MAQYDLNLLLNINDDTLGGRLSAARDAAGMDCATLALMSGIPLHCLKAWEADRCEADVHALAPLAKVLGVSRNWLETGEGEGPDDNDDMDMLHLARMELDRLMEMYQETGHQIEKLHRRIEDLQRRA